MGIAGFERTQSPLRMELLALYWPDRNVSFIDESSTIVYVGRNTQKHTMEGQAIPGKYNPRSKSKA
jgi:hypothetical protein